MSQTAIQILEAVREDSEQIRIIRDSTWGEDPCNPEYILKVIDDESHKSHVAWLDGRICGFVDSFMTRSAAGVLRWEVDLLAVASDARGKGIGKRLVQASVETGKQKGASMGRALIKVDNYASQGTFRSCGFKDGGIEHALYVSANGKTAEKYNPTQEGFFIPVNTINYCGIWVEEIFTNAAFRNALLAVKHEGLDVAGAVLPRADQQAIQNAVHTGFDLVGFYRWWYISLQ